MKVGITGAIVAAALAAGVGGWASAPASQTISLPVPSSVDELRRGPQLRGLAIEARGADFAGWIDDFEKTVHFNWDPPTYFGYGGQVEVEFTVEENGTITSLQVLESSASAPLEEAAREALTRSRLDPLPQDFDRLRVTMRVTFVYGPPPGE